MAEVTTPSVSVIETSQLSAEVDVNTHLDVRLLLVLLILLLLFSQQVCVGTMLGLQTKLPYAINLAHGTRETSKPATDADQCAWPVPQSSICIGAVLASSFPHGHRCCC